MALVGYARVSTTDQDLTHQVEVLTAAGCRKIFSEKISGSKKEGRQAFDECLDYLREGDTLVVTRIDRLSRSLRDLQNLVYDLEQQNIKLRATEQAIDTASASGKAFLDMLGVFAEFETNLRQERQREGIAQAKQQGKYKGRKPTARAKTLEVIELVRAGFTRNSVAKQLNIGKASVYRILKTYRLQNPDDILPGERSARKIATLLIELRVENNTKYVRGKSKVRTDIENEWNGSFDVEKPDPKGNDYILRVPYETEQELDELVDELNRDAAYAADMRYCSIELDVVHQETGKIWN